MVAEKPIRRAVSRSTEVTSSGLPGRGNLTLIYSRTTYCTCGVNVLDGIPQTPNTGEMGTNHDKLSKARIRSIRSIGSIAQREALDMFRGSQHGTHASSPGDGPDPTRPGRLDPPGLSCARAQMQRATSQLLFRLILHPQPGPFLCRNRSSGRDDLGWVPK